MQLTAAVEEWVTVIEDDPTYAKTSKHTYKATVRRFAKQQPDATKLKAIEGRHIERFIAGYAGTTKAAYLGGIRNFFGWCILMGYIKHNPMINVKKVRKRELIRKKVWVEGPDLRHMITSEKRPHRRWMLALATYTLMRDQQLQQLRFKDLRRQGDMPVIETRHIKSYHADKLGMFPILIEELNIFTTWYENYLVSNYGHGIQANMYLMPGTVKGAGGPAGLVRDRKTGKIRQWRTTLEPFKPNGRLNSYVNAALEDLDLREEGTGSHTLRRSGALDMYQSLLKEGVDLALDYVREMLGHADIATTEIYLGVTRGQAARNKLITQQNLIAVPEENTEQGLRLVT